MSAQGVSEGMKILIAGGGIAGLSAALCFARFGHDVTVLEQASAFAEVGAGLQVSPNAMKVLRALDLEAQSRAAGFEPERIEMRFGESGQTIFTIPLKGYAERRWGAPFLQFHRADLLGVLADAVMAHPAIQIEMSARVDSYVQMDESIEVQLTDGSVFKGDLLVGADGIHSIVRTQMLGKEAPEFTGCIAWRGTIPLDRLQKNPPPPTACAWVGRGKHAVTYRLGGERLVNFVGVVEQDRFVDESWSQRGTRDQIKRDFKGWHPVIQDIIDEGDEFFRWGLFGRPELSRWVDQRVALVGDACHPMLPFLAQGAVMAIEDAWVLARSVSADDRLLFESLRAFERVRKPRCTAVQQGARRNKTIFHLQNPAFRAGVYGAMKLGSMFTPNVVHARMNWIYEHDCTQ